MNDGLRIMREMAPIECIYTMTGENKIINSLHVVSHRMIIPIPMPKAPAIRIDIDVTEGIVAASFGDTLPVTLVPDAAVH